MKRIVVPVFLLLGGGLGVWFFASLLDEEPEPRADVAWDGAPTESAEVTQSPDARLLKVVVPCSAADLEDGRIPSSALREENEDGSRIYETTIGPIALSAYFADRGEADIVKQLGKAIGVAARWRKTAARDAEPWTFESLGPMGGYLRHPQLDLVVTDQTVLEAKGVAPRDAEAQIEGVLAAVANLMKEVRAIDAIDAWMTAALDDVLARLDDPPADESRSGLEPDFVRQIVSDPEWLRAVVPLVSATTRGALVGAVREARTLSPRARFGRGPALITYLGDAWRERGKHLRLGPLSAYARTPPMSLHAVSRRGTLRSCQLLYLLPDHADPVSVPDVLLRTGAFLLREGTLLATWDFKTGIGYDYRAWRRAFPRYKLPAVSGHWPPHVPIVAPDGTLYGLGTDQGFLRPPRDGGKAEVERFIADAARVLPRAAHLDLLQQYFVRYCLDTPSLSIPLMIGCREHSADVHQTVDQMLATVAGGVCRGDCDDFAELVHEIVRRQGRLAHVVSLPGHLATMWAETCDGEWRAYVMQTGPTLEFRGPDLGNALGQAFLRLAPDNAFDPDGVLLSLRFAGENTRSGFGLPARVFEDPEYAKTMIAVQGDWHASRYLRVLHTVRGLAADDESAGTLREYAAICARLGLHEEATDIAKRVLAMCSDLESRVLKKIEWVENALHAGRRAEVEAAIGEILEGDLPALVPQLGIRTLGIALDLVDALHEAPALAARALARTVGLQVDALEGSLADLLRPDVPLERWRKHKHHRRLQRLAYAMAWDLAIVTRKARAGKEPAVAKRLEVVAGPIDIWLERYALDDADGTRDGDRRWVLRAERRLASEPEFLDRILSATPLVAPDSDPPPAPTDAAIASHARTSVRFLAGVLTDLVHADERPDPARARRLLDVMANAARVQRRLGLQDAEGMNLLQRGCLAAALITREERSLRDALREIRLLNDRSATTRAAYVIGRFARHADAAWWNRAIRSWTNVMASDTRDCCIVWTAYRVGAIEHALAMSALAASRSPENGPLQEEARLFADFVAKGASAEVHQRARTGADR
jgi:hypothetical protein